MRLYVVIFYLLFANCIALSSAETPAVNTSAADAQATPVPAAPAAGPPRLAIANAVTFIGTEAAAAQLVKAVFAVQIPGARVKEDKSDEWLPIGSGFFYNGDKYLLGITCKHVVLDSRGTHKANLFVGVDTDKGYKRYQAKVIYVDSKYDLAILVIQYTDKERPNVQNITFDPDVFDGDKAIIEGRGVLITGYPLGLGTEDDKNHPIVRFGLISQNTNTSHFLIDGIASHGNSGSPVFALHSDRNSLAGMITDLVTDSIQLYDETGRLVSALPYNAGLARALRSSIIMSAIKEANKL